MLNDYLQQTERLLGFDIAQTEFALPDLTVFINMARRQVAAQGQCCRWLTPAGGPIQEIQIINAGHSYTAPILTVSAPDVPGGQAPLPGGDQAQATPIVIGGAIMGVTVDNGGDGYFNPTVKATDTTGHGALFKAITVPSVNKAMPLQEIYAFSDIDLGPNPGAKSILSVRNITLLWSVQQYTLQPMSFSHYMQNYRVYGNNSFLSQPAVWAQFGQGTSGTVRIYPPPNQEYAMQWDCLVLPDDLRDDKSYEAIPDPWRDAVPFYAAYLAILGRSYARPSLTPLVDKFYNPKDGGLFGDMMRRARAFSQPSQTRIVGV